jgi:two-component system, OmpR family, clock-associated histidine kinase SasA
VLAPLSESKPEPNLSESNLPASDLSKSSLPESSLQLLLFIDDRPTARDLVKEIQQFLQCDRGVASELQIINVSVQPYLAERFKVVMTPALVKIAPLPRQTIAGKNLVSKLKANWSRWQEQLKTESTTAPPDHNIAYSSELIKLGDEIFRISQDNRSIQEQLRFKDRIIAMLAHDLRNPLTAVSLALETVEIGSEKLTPQMANHLLRHGRKQIKMLDAMIVDILEAARGTSSEFQIHPRRLQLGDLCEAVASDFSLVSRLEVKQQTLVTDIPKDLPLVYADEERVRQVLTNIIGNAIKYTPVGGKIAVDVLHRTAQKVEVTVTDNGPGIPDELRDRIFEDRFRVEQNDNKGGYGIGLSVCQRIIRAHYGQIWADSPDKEGSCFHFTLPVY